MRYDMICIGSGPAGQRAAVQTAKLGRRAVVIDPSGVPPSTFACSPLVNRGRSPERGSAAEYGTIRPVRKEGIAGMLDCLDTAILCAPLAQDAGCHHMRVLVQVAS